MEASHHAGMKKPAEAGLYQQEWVKISVQTAASSAVACKLRLFPALS